MGALITIIIGGLLCAVAGFLITYGQIGMQQSVNAIGSSSCAALNLVHTAEWGDDVPWDNVKGHSAKQHSLKINPANVQDDSASFLGVRGLIDKLNGLKGLCTQHSPTSISQLLKGQLNRSSATIPTEKLYSADYAFKHNMDAFKYKTEQFYMKSYLVELADKTGTDFFASFVDAQSQYEELINTAVSNINLPEIDIGNNDELQALQAGLNAVEGAGAAAVAEVTPIANLLPVVFWSEISFMLSGIGLGVLALVLFFLTKGRQATCLSGLAWNWLLLTVSLSLLTTGALFFASSAGSPLCDAGVQTVVPSGGSKKGGEQDDNMNTQSDSTGTHNNIILDCLKEDNHNLLDDSSLATQVDSARYKLNEVKTEIMKIVPPKIEIPSSQSTF